MSKIRKPDTSWISHEAMDYIEKNHHRFSSEVMARYLKMKVRTVKGIVQGLKQKSSSSS